MSATLQSDSIMQRLQMMAREIELTGDSRDLTELELLMSEMLVEGNKTHAESLRLLEGVRESVDNAIIAVTTWRRRAYCMAGLVWLLSSGLAFALTR